MTFYLLRLLVEILQAFELDNTDACRFNTSWLEPVANVIILAFMFRRLRLLKKRQMRLIPTTGRKPGVECPTPY